MAIFPLVALAMIEVILRYVFNSPTIWVWDVNVQLLAAITVLGTGYTLLAKGHVSVDILVSRFSPQKRAIIDLSAAVVFFGSVGVIVWQTGIAAWVSLETRELYTSIWQPPIYPLKIMIAVGAFLLFLQGIVKFIRDLAIATQKSGETS